MSVTIPDTTACDRRTATTIAYGPGQLPSLLLKLQGNRASGVIRINATSGRGGCRRSIVFCEGQVVYAGKAIPTPRELLTEISQHLQVGALDAAMQFAAKRSSIQESLDMLVKVGVLQWSEIIAATRKQAVGVLQELLAMEGKASFGPRAATFDLYYRCPNGERALGFTVDGLIAEARRVPQSPAPKSKGPATRATILSVDDSLSAQAVVQSVLGSQYCVEACDNPIAAMTILCQRNDIALLLLDIMLPDINGLDFCQMMRKRFKDLPIVMVTGRDGALSKMRGRMAGATDYVTKPVNPAELSAVVARAIASKSPAR